MFVSKTLPTIQDAATNQGEQYAANGLRSEAKFVRKTMAPKYYCFHYNRRMLLQIYTYTT